MQTLQTTKELKKYKRQQAFIMVEKSVFSGFDKGTVGTVRQSHTCTEHIDLTQLRNKQLKARQASGYTTEVDSFIENPKSVSPFTIGMSVKPQEGWKVIKQ